MMARTSAPFPGSLDVALRSSKSLLFIPGPILTGCRRDASARVPAGAGAEH